MESKNSSPLKILAYVLLVFAALGLLIRLVNIRNPLNGLDGMDEMTYVLIARRLMLGELPYHGGFDHKPIGLYYVFVLFFQVFGYTLTTIRLMPIAAIALTSWLLYAIVKTHLPAQRQGLGLSAVVFMTTCTSFGNGGLVSNTEILQMPVFAAWWLVALNWTEFRWQRALMLGALTGAAAQINYLGGSILALSTAVMLAWPLLDKFSWKTVSSFLIDAMLALATFALITLMALLPLIIADDLSQYFRLQFGTLAGYQGTMNNEKLLRAILSIAISAGFFLSLLACKVWCEKSFGTYSQLQRTVLIQLAVVFFVTLVMIGMTKRLYPHYFNLLVVPSTLVLILLLGDASSLVLRRFTFLAGILAALLISRGVWDVYLKDWSGDFKQQHEIAQLAQEIQKHSKPGDKVLLLNLNHTLYFLADVVPATRFFFRGQIFLDRFLSTLDSSPAREIGEAVATKPTYVMACFDNSAAGYRSLVDNMLLVNYAAYNLPNYRECLDLKAYYLPPSSKL